MTLPELVEASGYSMDDTRTATRLSKVEVYTLPGGTADVLHAFQKKAKKSIATPQRETEVVKRRLRAAEDHYRSTYEKG